MAGTDLVEMYEPRFLSERHRSFYGDTGYSNFGYWADGVASGHEACDRLLDRLLAHVPTPPSKILDVACGEGGTTTRVQAVFPNADVTAINISPGQLARASLRCPRVTFLRMDATRLDFEDASFDVVLCVEAAYHFDTRERFLREAFRVLRPGGTILMTDGIIRQRLGPVARRLVPDLADMPAENFVDLGGYERLFLDIGYRDVDIERAIDRTFDACRRRFMRHTWGEYLRPSRWPGVLRESPAPLVALWWSISRQYLDEYLLVKATRPSEASP